MSRKSLLVWAALSLGGSVPCRAADLSTLVEFRDSYRPGMDAYALSAQPVAPWKPEEKKIIEDHFSWILEHAPGLLRRGGHGDRIAVYRYPAAGVYANGNCRRFSVGDLAFPSGYLDWTRRILVHELIHAVDCKDHLSGSAAWKDMAQPEVEKLRAEIARRGHTPATAAQMPLSPARDVFEKETLAAAALPSAYAAFALNETLAEVASFLIVEPKNLPAHEGMRKFVEKNILSTIIAPNPTMDAYLGASLQQSLGKHAEAVVLYDKALALDSTFSGAHQERGTSLNQLEKKSEALKAFDLAVKFQAPYSKAAAFNHMMRALLRAETGDGPGAVSDCAATMALNSRDYFAQFYCGRAHLAAGGSAAATAFFEQALATYPGGKAQIQPWLDKARMIK